MNSRLRILFACTLGVLIAIGSLLTLYIPGLSLLGVHMSSYTFISSKTGIAVEKLILLKYFLFMPWPVTNLRRVAYFQDINYARELESDMFLFSIAFHSLIFLFGAFIAAVLSGDKWKSDAEPRWNHWKSIPIPPWFSFTLQGRPPRGCCIRSSR